LLAILQARDVGDYLSLGSALGEPEQTNILRKSGGAAKIIFEIG
jgi:hypothetical protein